MRALGLIRSQHANTITVLIWIVVVTEFEVLVESNPSETAQRNLQWWEHEEERLVGWQGEVPQPLVASTPNPPEVISWQNPR